MNRAIITLALGATLVGAASAVTISSFHSGTISGVSSTLAGTDMSVSMSQGATFVFQGNTYSIQFLFGAYELGTGGSLTATQGTAPAHWAWTTVSLVAGYDDNAKKNPLNPTNSPFDFTFGSISGTGLQAGYHAMFDKDIIVDGVDTGGKTAFITGSAPVPEPASYAVLVVGTIGLLVRRKKR